MSPDDYIGSISMVGFTFAPRGSSFCNGQLMAIAQNTALFSLLGTTYGGDGRTTFAAPDLRGRAPINSGGDSGGPGLTPRPLGARSGTETNTLTVNQMPSHNHLATATPPTITVDAVMNAEDGGGTSANPKNNMFASLPGLYKPFDAPNNKAMAPEAITATATAGAVDVTVLNAGLNLPINNMQPWLAINFCIALIGIFPSRN